MPADNKGFQYENRINSLMKKYKVSPPGFIPAGADSNAPDAMLLYQGKEYKVEVKLDTKVDFGQGSLDYDLDKKKWVLGGAKTASAENMREFLTSVGVTKIVNKEWGKSGPPRKFTVPLSQFKKEDVEFDYKNFTDRFVPIDGRAVANYYKSKETYYIQVGGFGMYYMGSDVADLGVSEFNLQLKLRIRLKRGGSYPIYNYRFTTAIQAVSGSLKATNQSLDNEEYLKALAGRNQK